MSQNIKVDAIALAVEVVELRNEIARLKNQTNWVCSCGGTDCEGQRENAALQAHAERLGEANDQLVLENAALRATLDAVFAADERAVGLWRAAHPGNELVIPDRAKITFWLLEQSAARKEAQP